MKKLPRSTRVNFSEYPCGYLTSANISYHVRRHRQGSYNLEKVLNFSSHLEKSLNSLEVLEKYLISLLGLEKSLKFTTLSAPDTFFYKIRLFC